MLALILVCAIIALLLASPVTLRFRYDGQPRMRVWYLCFFYNIPLDSEQKARKQRKKSPKEKRKKKKEEQAKKADPFRALVEKKGLLAAVSDICGTVHLLLERAARLFSHVRVVRLRLKSSVGGSDAAQAAVLCGGVCAAVYPLLGFASALVHLRAPYIDIQPNYHSSDWSVQADCKLRVALWWFLAAGGAAAWALIQSKVKQSKVHQFRAAPSRQKKKQSKKGGV